MASFTATADGESIRVRVSGLTSGDEVCIVIRYADDAEGYVAGTPKYYTASGSSMTHTYSVDPGVYAVNISVNNTWGTSKTVYVEEEVVRPDDWTWDRLDSSEVNINLRADDWNDFVARINEFRGYKGMGGYTFWRVYAGDEIAAETVNDARQAISEISGHGTLPARAVSMQTELTVSYLNRLASALNAVS